LENGKRLIFDKQLKSNKSKLTPADRAHSAMTASHHSYRIYWIWLAAVTLVMFVASVEREHPLPLKF
ncbi:hypothetical protein T4A_157, partial [Trichinella pseudospiralis]